MLFGIILVVVGFILVAMLWNEGMWGNALTFVNIVFSFACCAELFRTGRGHAGQSSAQFYLRR